MSARLNGPLFPKFLRAKVFCIFWPRYLHVFFGLQIQPREPQAGDKTCLFGYVTPLIFCYLYFRITCLFVECRSLSLSSVSFYPSAVHPFVFVCLNLFLSLSQYVFLNIFLSVCFSLFSISVFSASFYCSMSALTFLSLSFSALCLFPFLSAYISFLGIALLFLIFVQTVYFINP